LTKCFENFVQSFGGLRHWMVTPFTGNLIEWLTDELDAEEKQEIISMLESKNIILSI